MLHLESLMKTFLEEPPQTFDLKKKKKKKKSIVFPWKW